MSKNIGKLEMMFILNMKLRVLDNEGINFKDALEDDEKNNSNYDLDINNIIKFTKVKN